MTNRPQSTKRKSHRIPALGGLLLLVVALVYGGSQLLAWRAGKLALLVPPAPVAAGVAAPVSALPASAQGGLLIIGDSRVADWPAVAQPYPVVMAGHAGESAIRMPPLFVAAQAQHRPAAILLMAGVNDAIAASLAGPAARATALNNSLAAIDTMAALARESGARLMISLVVPPSRPGLTRRLVYGKRVDRYVAELNAGIPAIAARHGAEIFRPLAVLGDAAGDVHKAYRRDALHFTPAAYAAMTNLLPDQLPPLSDSSEKTG